MRAIAAVEAALVELARGALVAPAAVASSRDRWALAAATCGAIASRFLAVGTPRSFGVIAIEADDDVATRCLDTHAHWFAPRELRRADPRDRDATRAACAADIVCVCSDAAVIDPSWLRRGTHVNLLRGAIDRTAPALAHAVIADVATLAAMVAGRIDGRQLDELTLFAPRDPAELAVAEAALAPA